MEAEKTTDQEATDKSANDADDQVGQQSMIAAGDPLGNPTSQDTNDNTRDHIHGWLLQELSEENARAQGLFRADKLVDRYAECSHAGPAAFCFCGQSNGPAYLQFAFSSFSVCSSTLAMSARPRRFAHAISDPQRVIS
jgi:hypothetical protein